MLDLGDEGTGETSICCDEENAPIEYHWYRAPGEVAMEDAFIAIVGPLAKSDIELEYFRDEYRARLEMLRQGRLLAIHNVKGPMRDEKRFEMFELRFRLASGLDEEHYVRVRAYHVEPTSLRSKTGCTVVGLHMHHKDTDAEDVDDQQASEIKVAAARFFVAQSSKWGL